MSEHPAERLARGYYEAIDAGEYDRLARLLAGDFRHERGDRTIEGREAFVRFMREGRPKADTTHEVDAVYTSDDRGEVAARGRLLHSDGSLWFEFVDVFEVADGAIRRLATYTR